METLLIVTDTWEEVNGISTSLKRLTEALSARGISVSVLHPRLGPSMALPFYPELRLALRPMRLVRQRFEAGHFSYIHIATEGPLGRAARRFCIKKRIRFTSAYHTHWPAYLAAYVTPMFLPSLTYAYLRRFHNASAATLVSGPSFQKELTLRGFTNVVVSPLGVDASFFTRKEGLSVPAPAKPVFVYFGRIAREKNVEEFLKLKLPGTKLVIGDGPEKERLEKEYGRENRFVGYKRGSELIEWLSLCDVFVFPSRTETFGLVVLEALSMGIPVAAHQVMGPQDLIENGTDGFLGEDLSVLAEKCLSIPRANCRKKALAYSWDRSADIFKENIRKYS